MNEGKFFVGTPVVASTQYHPQKTVRFPDQWIVKAVGLN
jgi:hypothetical protein